MKRKINSASLHLSTVEARMLTSCPGSCFNCSKYDETNDFCLAVSLVIDFPMYEKAPSTLVPDLDLGDDKFDLLT